MSLRIAHLSDIHFGGENPEAVAAALVHVQAAQPTVTVLSGDLTLNGEESEFIAAQAWAAALPAPVLAVPGNHDTPYFSLTKRFAEPWKRYETAFGAPEPRLLGEGFAICGLNSARGAQMRFNWSKGAMRRSQAREAAKWLNAAPDDALRIVTCHHPLVEMLGGPMSGEVHGGEKAAEIFSEARVDLVLTGHVHAPFVLAYPYADGRTYAVGAGTLSTRERGCPAGFTVIDVEPHALRITALGWTGSGFENWRTWSVERRAPLHPA